MPAAPVVLNCQSLIKSIGLICQKKMEKKEEFAGVEANYTHEDHNHLEPSTMKLNTSNCAGIHNNGENYKW